MVFIMQLFTVAPDTSLVSMSCLSLATIHADKLSTVFPQIEARAS